MGNKCYLCGRRINKEGKLRFCKPCDKRITRKLPLFLHCKPTERSLNNIIKMVADVLKKQDRRMFRMGKTIKSMDTLIKKLQKNEWVIIKYGGGHNKPHHPVWIINMHLRVVVYYLQTGRICEAIKNKRRIR